MAKYGLESKTDEELRELAAQNSSDWFGADKSTQAALHAENERINAILDSRNNTATTYNADTGVWTTAPAAGNHTSYRGNDSGDAGNSYSGNSGTKVNIVSGGLLPMTDVTDALAAAQTQKPAQTISFDDIMAYINSAMGQYQQPAYNSTWDETKEALARAALEMNYDDWTKSDQYKNLAARYGHNGRLGMQDVLGQISARTGGMASSYATTAAQQQYNEYMAELEAAARSMYSGERSDAIQNAQLAYNYGDDDYQRYLDRLGQYNTDRNYAFQVLSEALNQSNYANEWQNTLQQQALAQANYENERDYSRSQEALARQDAADASAVYGYSNNGGSYKVSSAKGLNFINNAAPGATLSDTGDGSEWTKNADGSVTIRTSDGTYTVAGSGTGFQTGLSYAQQLLNQGYGASYIHGILASQGYSTDMIDLIFTQLGL